MKQYRRKILSSTDEGVTLEQFISSTWYRAYASATMFFDKEAQFELMRRIVSQLFKSDVDLAHDADVVLECVDLAEHGNLSPDEPELDYGLLQIIVDQLYNYGNPSRL